MTRKQRRLVTIAICSAVFAVAVALILTSLDGSITFFKSPSDVVSEKIQFGTRLRLGSIVETGSVYKGGSQLVIFRVTDGSKMVAVRYIGLLPDLFREGQGVVAEGTLREDGSFAAQTILARHDEKYMPREVADALKKQGHWKADGSTR